MRKVTPIIRVWAVTKAEGGNKTDVKEIRRDFCYFRPQKTAAVSFELPESLASLIDLLVNALHSN